MFSKLGRFEIKEVLGRGAMGEVYLGLDPSLGREVAIKTIISSALPEDQARQRFEREAKAAAVLNSPNIVTIHELGEDQGLLFIAMERLRGKDLEQLLLEKSLTLAESLEVLAQVCDGLDTAHRNHIIHRDIKPSNVMVMREGRRLLVKLMDFGVARLKDSAMTVVGTVMGTVNYIAPEYIRNGEPDARSDLFAVGVMLYECISGKKPFEGASASTVLLKIVNEPPEPIDASQLQGISPAVQSVLDMALAKKPEDRYQTAEELAMALRAAKDPAWQGKVEEATVRMKVRPAVEPAPAPPLAPPSSETTMPGPAPVAPIPQGPIAVAAAHVKTGEAVAVPPPVPVSAKAEVVQPPPPAPKPLAAEDPFSSKTGAGEAILPPLSETPPPSATRPVLLGLPEVSVPPKPTAKTEIVALPKPAEVLPAPVATTAEERTVAQFKTEEVVVPPELTAQPPVAKTVVMDLSALSAAGIVPPLAAQSTATADLASAKAKTGAVVVPPELMAQPPVAKTVVMDLSALSAAGIAPPLAAQSTATADLASAKAKTGEVAVPPELMAPTPPAAKTVALNLVEPRATEKTVPECNIPAAAPPTEPFAAPVALAPEDLVFAEGKTEEAVLPPYSQTVVLNLPSPSAAPASPPPAGVASTRTGEVIVPPELASPAPPAAKTATLNPQGTSVSRDIPPRPEAVPPPKRAEPPVVPVPPLPEDQTSAGTRTGERIVPSGPPAPAQLSSRTITPGLPYPSAEGKPIETPAPSLPAEPPKGLEPASIPREAAPAERSCQVSSPDEADVAKPVKPPLPGLSAQPVDQTTVGAEAAPDANVSQSPAPVAVPAPSATSESVSGAERPSMSPTMPILGILAFLLLGAAGYFFYRANHPKPESVSPVPVASSPSPVPPAPAPAPAQEPPALPAPTPAAEPPAAAPAPAKPQSKAAPTTRKKPAAAPKAPVESAKPAPQPVLEPTAPAAAPPTPPSPPPPPAEPKTAKPLPPPARDHK